MFNADSTTAEQCLMDAKPWLEQLERTAEDVAELLRAIRARTRKDVTVIISAVAMFLNEQDEVLLLRRTPQDRSYPGTYSLPGGQHDPEDASLEETALREGSEETGLLGRIVKRHQTLHVALPRRERIYQVTAFEMARMAVSSRSVTLSPEHDEAVFLRPHVALERDAAGTLPLAGQATRQGLRALMHLLV